MRKIVIALLAFLTAFHAQAQFNIEYKDGQNVRTSGNVTIENEDDTWMINQTEAGKISSISRYPRSASEAVVLDKSLGGIYFGDFWKEGYGDYYFLLTNDKLGQNSKGELVPMNSGGYLLYVDIWADLSADHNHPVLPEGKYVASTARKNGCFTTEFSLLTVNKGKTENGYQIVDHQIVNGEMVVKHVEDGYLFTATIETKDGQKFDFRYVGHIEFEDRSGIQDDEDNKFITTDVNIQPVLARYMLYPKSTTDNYVLRLFDVEEISADGVHPIVPGMKLNLDIFTAKGADIEGTYKVGTKVSSYSIKEEAGVFFPGTYYAGIPLGSFCERVNSDLSVSHCGITDGTLTIKKVSEDTYHVKAELISDKGKSVICDWTGVILPN